MNNENNAVDGGKSLPRRQPDIPQKFLKPYDSVSTEERLYKSWEEAGYFNPDHLPKTNSSGETFSIVLPPPNVTGNLHMGSALMLAIEDIMVRHARMKGMKALWIPGTDHAAIATQSVVEKDIQKKEGKSRHDLGREELLRRIADHVKVTHDTIVAQMRKMGCSVDWSREAFTLDDKRNLAVRTAFKKMFDDGLIYRGQRVVNWDPKGQTTISDDEIEHETRKTTLYTFSYGKHIPILISTTRPETKLGDTAIAVHPDDDRYKAFVGQEYDADFAGEKIHVKVIADPSVEKDFGTGALGVTPAHSTIDWEMAQRHGLPSKQIIDEYARMTVGGDGIKGKKTTEARVAVVEWIKAQGLMTKEEEIEHNVSVAQRTGGVIEPLPKLQWFIAVNKEFKHGGRTVTLKQLMREAVSNKDITGSPIRVIPDRFQKVYFNWIDNLRDWCISRQIWYGHRIPVWYRGEDIHCDLEEPSGAGWKQDEDTLDTWFSSGLWTFSTLGWPNEKEFASMRKFHPTTVLETGSDILFFWVARMILMTTYILGEVPFKTVYLHGLVRDTKNRKISKSLGNNIDPVDMISKYGADAVRMSLIVGVGPGNDSKIDEAKIKAYKLFANKLWNITRFVLESTEGETLESDFEAYSKADAAHNENLAAFLKEISAEMDEYKFYIVAEKLYHYVWHQFADTILEESKTVFKSGDAEQIKSRKQFLLHALASLLKGLHPFMPFVTEEIWMSADTIRGKSKDAKNTLMVEKWPE